MSEIRGCSLTHDQFRTMVLEAQRASHLINMRDHEVVITIHGNCGGVAVVFKNEEWTPACVAKYGEFMRFLYATIEVCQSVIPASLPSSGDINSLAQGIADQSIHLAEIALNDLVRVQIQQYVAEVLRRAYESQPPTPI